MRRSPCVAVAAMALAAGLAREAAAQAGFPDPFTLPRHGEARPLPLASTQGVAELDPLCGSVVTGVLVLDRDVLCGNGGDGLFLGQGATLDLGGFTYEGDIYGFGANTVLRNGTLANVFIDFYHCSDCRIEEVHVRDSRGLDWFVVGLGLRNLVRASRFTGNTVALDLYDYYGFSRGDNTVVDCVFEDNYVGVNIASHSGNLVASNAFRGNGSGVNLWDEDLFGVNDNTISGNEFVENTYGITHGVVSCGNSFLHRCQQGNRFTDNVFRRNERRGMSVRDFGECEEPWAQCDAVEMSIADNLFDANGFGLPAPPGLPPVGADGLRVAGPPELTDGIHVARNVAIANAALGIEAPGVEDGGGNRARANGDPLQCVGVVCERIVDVDVWPGRRRAHVHPHHGLIPVAILGAQDFDVREVDVRSLAFGPNAARPERHPRPRRRDVNRDGVADLLVVWRARGTGIAFGDREVCVSGRIAGDIAFGGCDAIVTAKPRVEPGRHGGRHQARLAHQLGQAQR